MSPENGIFHPVSAKDMWAFGITVENDVLKSWFPGRGPRISTIVKETLRNSRWHDSLCLQALHKIPLLALKKLHARPSDNQMLEYIHRSYDSAMEVKTIFSFMLNHGAVMLSQVSKKRTSMFHYRGDRDVFITPRLDRILYKHVYGCQGLPLQRNAPYIIWKSLKHVRYAYKNEWRCYAVKAARKNTDGSITVETMEDGIRYNMRLSRSDCLRGSCQNTIGYKTKNQAQDQRADNLVAAIN